MKGYEPPTYGDRIAAIYDEMYGPPPEQAITALAALAGDGPVLELGIGTGRVALPLAARGVDVHGVDASPSMLDQLRSKPGADALSLTEAAFESFALEERFTLVFVVFNTFFALLDQEAQAACFERVVRHLMPGGRFLLQCFVPDLSRFDRAQRVSVTRVEQDRVVLDATMHDAARQRVDSQHIVITDEGVQLFPVALRYAWPAELDLMARLAGLEQEQRWGGWAEEPFTADSQSHVTVYRRPDESP